MTSVEVPNTPAVTSPVELFEYHHSPADGRKIEISVLSSPSKSNGLRLGCPAGCWIKTERVKTPFVILIAPVRGGPVFGATEYPIAPLPSPDAAEVTVTNEESADAAHEQPPGIVISIVPEPPDAGKDKTVGEIEKTHAPVDVSRSRAQSPEILPMPLPESSTTNRLHAPFGGVPKKDVRDVPVGAPAGAGAGNTSPGSWFVGL
jgi:hypothetical protein